MASQDSQPFHWHYGELNDKNFQLHGKGLLLLIILFSICLILTLLCLYAKWICRYRQQLQRLNNPISGTASTTTTTDSVPQMQLPNRGQSQSTAGTGLDPVTINSLPIHLYHHFSSSTPPAAGEVQCCCICLSSFQEGDKVKALPDCHHSFHPECVDMWLTNQPSCPLCRACLIRTPKVESAHELA